jgi:hypothetical protein
MTRSEPLPWREICRRYPNQWVTLVCIDWIDDGFEFRSAIVIGAGPYRSEAVRQARPLLNSFTEFGCFSTRRHRAAADPLPRVRALA